MNDSGLELMIGRVMRTGVWLSSACLACGLAMFLIHPGDGSWLLQIGIIALIATPVLRVAVSIVDYSIQRDWTFTILTTLVLVELAASVVAALVFHRRL